jgi:hypothetical protein
MIANPGNRETHGAIVRYCTPRFTIFPQVGVGGATPNPKKLKLASTLIAVDVHRLLMTNISPSILGVICFTTILEALAPIA